MRPDDANVAGNVHGGTILKMIEEAGAIISTRHCNSQNRVGVWGRSPAWERPPAGGPAVLRTVPLLGQGGVWEEEPSPPRSSALGTSGSSTPPDGRTALLASAGRSVKLHGVARCSPARTPKPRGRAQPPPLRRSRRRALSTSLSILRAKRVSWVPV